MSIFIDIIVCLFFQPCVTWNRPQLTHCFNATVLLCRSSHCSSSIYNPYIQDLLFPDRSAAFWPQGTWVLQAGMFSPVYCNPCFSPYPQACTVSWQRQTSSFRGSYPILFFSISRFLMCHLEPPSIDFSAITKCNRNIIHVNKTGNCSPALSVSKWIRSFTGIVLPARSYLNPHHLKG